MEKLINTFFTQVRSYKYSQSIFFLFIFLSLFWILYDSKLSIFFYKFFPNNSQIEVDDLDFKSIGFYIFLLFTASSLYIKTNKKELRRYKSYYELIEKYSNEKKNLLFLRKYNQKIYSNSIDYSKSIKNFDLNKKLKLENIIFNIKEVEYKLPELISSKMHEILQDRFNTQSKEDYNGLTLSLKNIYYSEVENKLTFDFFKSNYYKYLVTNVSPNYKILGNLSIDDYLESAANNKLNRLEDSLAENHLGISCLIILIDKEKNERFIIIPKRGNNTTVFKGELSPSISGALNIHSCYNNELDIPSIRNFFIREFEEEIEDVFNKSKIEKLKEILIEELELIGISRELKRIGKPEIFFSVEISYSFLDNKDSRKIELNNSDKLIDFRENDNIFIINEKDLEQIIEEKVTKNFINCTYDKEVIMKIKNEKAYLKVSESLFINLIYYFKKKL